MSSKLQKKVLPKLQLLSAKLRRVGKFDKEHRQAAKFARGGATAANDAIPSDCGASGPMEINHALVAWRLRKRLQSPAKAPPDRHPPPRVQPCLPPGGISLSGGPPILPRVQPCPPPGGTHISSSGGPPILPMALRTTEGKLASADGSVCESAIAIVTADTPSPSATHCVNVKSDMGAAWLARWEQLAKDERTDVGQPRLAKLKPAKNFAELALRERVPGIHVPVQGTSSETDWPA